MHTKNVCPNCGLPMPAGAAEGLCPRCLLEAGLSASLIGEDSSEPDAMPAFGVYQTIGVLGEGGMGIVYLAEQPEPLRRRVALKVLKRTGDRRAFIARFESERQALALMDHPNIAHVYDAGTTADGRPYFVMEYVPGVPITEYCDQNLLGLIDRLALFQQVCRAVQHAHQKGIIHRDLKPSNVLVILQDGKPAPKVIDFGVAKAVNQGLTGKTLLTEWGMLVGTPEYMSPEQAGGTGLDIDTTSDVYSLGVLLYELLVGALPFDAKALRRAGQAEIQRLIREEEPPRPTTRLNALGETAEQVARQRSSDVRTLVRLLRGDLEWIVMKALEKDRGRRYASASEFASDIARHLSNEPVEAGPPSLTYRFAKLARRHRGKVTAATILMATILAGLAATTFMYFRADRARSVAEWQAYKARLAAARSDIEEFRSTEARELLFQVPRKMRGWEWNYLYWASDTTLATLNSGERAAYAGIGFSTDSSKLFVSTATSVHQWTLGDFRRVADYGPFGPILAMSGDGSLVASKTRSYASNSVEIAEVATGKTVAVLKGHKAAVVDACFSADKSRLVTISRDNEIRVWNAAAGLLLTTLAAGNPPSRPNGVAHELIAISPDGNRVAWSEQNRLRLWDLTSRRNITVPDGHFAPIQFLAFTADSRRIITLGDSVRIWDAGSGLGLSTWSSTGGRGFRAAMESPNGLHVATVGWMHGIEIWVNSSGQIASKLSGFGLGAPSAIAYSPNGRYLVCVDNRGVVRVWDGPSLGGHVLVYAQPHPARGTSNPVGTDLAAMAVSADGSRVAVGDGPAIKIVDARHGARLTSWERKQTEPVRVLAFDPRGRFMASGCEDASVCIWDQKSPLPQLRLKGHRRAVTALTYSPDGKRLVSGSDDRSVRLWEVDSGRLVFTREFDGPVRGLAFSPQGRFVAVSLSHSASATGEREPPNLQILDSRTGTALPPLEGIASYRGIMRASAFSPSGSSVVSGDLGEQGAAIWEVGTGKRLCKLAVAGKQGVGSRSFAFLPGGSRVLGAFGDGSLAIWRPQDGDLVLQLFSAPVLNLQFSPDGSRLYLKIEDSIRVYQTQPAIPAEAQEILPQLQQRFPLYCDLRMFLQNDQSLEPRIRQALQRMVEGRAESPEAVRIMVDHVVRSPGKGHAAYQEALRRARMISQPRPWDAAALEGVGRAEYRTGNYIQAVAALERASRLQADLSLQGRLFMAMAHSELGHAEQALKFLRGARDAISKQGFDKENPGNIRQLLAEAESTLKSHGMPVGAANSQPITL